MTGIEIKGIFLEQLDNDPARFLPKPEDTGIQAVDTVGECGERSGNRHAAMMA